MYMKVGGGGQRSRRRELEKNMKKNLNKVVFYDGRTFDIQRIVFTNN